MRTGDEIQRGQVAQEGVAGLASLGREAAFPFGIFVTTLETRERSSTRPSDLTGSARTEYNA